MPSFGGFTPPSAGPPHPGPFVDPGQALRDEAERILSEARQALDEAGAAAVVALGGLEGARTEGSTGPSVEGSVEGPSISWEGFEQTFGRNPTEGADGRYDNGAADSPFKISLGEVEGSARAWGAEGTWEDYYGDVRVTADGSVTVLGADAHAEASVGRDGVVIGADGKVVLAGAQGSLEGEWGYAEGRLEGETFVGGHAGGQLDLGLTGAHASGELFAGAKIEGTASGDVGGVGAEATAEGWAGVGIGGDVDLGFEDGKFTIGGSGGAALGLGGKLGGSITIDPGEVLDTGQDIVEGIGDLLP